LISEESRCLDFGKDPKSYLIVDEFDGTFNGTSNRKFKCYAGFYPLQNLADPKNPVAQIRILLVKAGQNSGRTRLRFGGPGVH